MPTTMASAARPEAARSAGALNPRRQLYRFPKAQRERVLALAGVHARLADLAISFPALLFALAVPRAGFDPRAAIARVCAGKSLKTLGHAAGLPGWLKNVPPEAFVRPLPTLPDGEAFRLQIANHIPEGNKLLPFWLEAIGVASALAHEAFALWIAREVYHEKKQARLTHLLCLWAWYSCQPGTQGHALMARRWSMEIGYRAATAAALAWQDRVELELAMGDGNLEDVWLTPGIDGGYTFVPLRSSSDLVEEAAAMQNCVTNYGYQLAYGNCRLFSMRKDGERVATLQIGRNGADPYPQIMQLAGPKNEACGNEIWWFARQWVFGHGPDVVTPAPTPQAEDMLSAHWRRMWKPYWHAKGRVPDWLPLASSSNAFYALTRQT